MSGLLNIPPRLAGLGSQRISVVEDPLVYRWLDLLYTTLATALRASTQITQAGTVTVTGSATTGTFTFSTTAAEPNTTYTVTAVPVTVSGGAAAGASRVRSIAKAAGSLTITVEAAPTGAETVVFDVLVVRVPSP